MWLINKTLSNPVVFDLQQNLCNNYENVKNEFVELKDRCGLSILDIGCSTGVCGQKVFDVVNNDYTGIDISSEYIEYAKKKYRYGDYCVMNGTKLSFSDDIFDVVSFIGVLHHMDDEIARACIKEARRVLKPNGILLIGEPIFTANKLVSNILLSLDRGKYIRESQKYVDLLQGLHILRTGVFGFSQHSFFSIVAAK